MTTQEHNLLVSLAKAQLAELTILSQLLAKNHYALDQTVVMKAMKDIGAATGGLEYDLSQIDHK